VNRETETIVATGAILAGIPCVDRIDIDKIKTGDKLIVNADEGTVEFE
jgi:predicted aconitase with swiveling domain